MHWVRFIAPDDMGGPTKKKKKTGACAKSIPSTKFGNIVI